jgi:cellulose biosynthesis protein BcsQ
MQNTIHFVLQAKGGIGKSFVSTLLAQYLLQ